MSAAAPTIRDSSSRQDEPERVAGRSPRQLIWAHFREDRAALIGLAVLVLLALIAIFAGVISKHLAGHAPDELFQQTMTDEFGLPLGPNWEFFFGGDSVGRDLFVRVIYGARTSLLIAGVATGVSVVIGTFLGLLAGYYGGFLDSVVSRITDVMLAIPYLLFALGVAAACNKTEEGCLGGLRMMWIAVESSRVRKLDDMTERTHGSRRPQSGALQPLPARVLGRSATTHRCRSRAGVAAAVGGVRRAGLGTGRVDSSPDHQPHGSTGARSRSTSSGSVSPGPRRSRSHLAGAPPSAGQREQMTTKLVRNEPLLAVEGLTKHFTLLVSSCQ